MLRWTPDHHGREARLAGPHRAGAESAPGRQTGADVGLVRHSQPLINSVTKRLLGMVQHDEARRPIPSRKKNRRRPRPPYNCALSERDLKLKLSMATIPAPLPREKFLPR